MKPSHDEIEASLRSKIATRNIYTALDSGGPIPWEEVEAAIAAAIKVGVATPADLVAAKSRSITTSRLWDIVEALEDKLGPRSKPVF